MYLCISARLGMSYGNMYEIHTKNKSMLPVYIQDALKIWGVIFQNVNLFFNLITMITIIIILPCKDSFDMVNIYMYNVAIF